MYHYPKYQALNVRVFYEYVQYLNLVTLPQDEWKVASKQHAREVAFPYSLGLKTERSFPCHENGRPNSTSSMAHAYDLTSLYQRSPGVSPGRNRLVQVHLRIAIGTIAQDGREQDTASTLYMDDRRLAYARDYCVCLAKPSLRLSALVE